MPTKSRVSKPNSIDQMAARRPVHPNSARSAEGQNLNKVMTMTPDLYADPQNPAPKADKLRVQAPYWYRFYVGEAEITVVSDGWQMLGDPSDSFLGCQKTRCAKS